MSLFNNSPKKFEYKKREVFLPRDILFIIRNSQWVIINSILALIGIKDSLNEGSFQPRAIRRPQIGEIFFENFPIPINFEEKFKKHNFYLKIRIQKNQNRTTSQFLIIETKHFEMVKNISIPILFNWEEREIIGIYTSSIEIETVIFLLLFFMYRFFRNKKFIFKNFHFIFQGYSNFFFNGIYGISFRKKTQRCIVFS